MDVFPEWLGIAKRGNGLDLPQITTTFSRKLKEQKLFKNAKNKGNPAKRV
jgi:hypothetical protein